MSFFVALRMQQRRAELLLVVKGLYHTAALEARLRAREPHFVAHQRSSRQPCVRMPRDDECCCCSASTAAQCQRSPQMAPAASAPPITLRSPTSSSVIQQLSSVVVSSVVNVADGRLSSAHMAFAVAIAVAPVWQRSLWLNLLQRCQSQEATCDVQRVAAGVGNRVIVSRGVGNRCAARPPFAATHYNCSALEGAAATISADANPRTRRCCCSCCCWCRCQWCSCWWCCSP